MDLERPQRSVLKRGERGQSAVELALSLPLLLLVLMGALDFGRAFFAYISLANAAREGAQYGTWYPTDSSGNTNTAAIAALVNQEVSNTGISPVSVTVVCLDYSSNAAIDCNTVHIGDRISVVTGYRFGLITTGILPFGNSIQMYGFATMAIIKGQLPAHP